MEKYVIYGLGISGISAAKFFAKENYKIIATDDNQESIIRAKNSLDSKNIEFLNPDEINYNKDTIIIFSPGIPLYFPKKHQILEIVEKTGAKLACDIEIFYQRNKNNDFIAITGTNGKSTTTSLTGFVLKDLGLKTKIGGNIGTACFELEECDKNKTTFVLETSSYQLDLLSDCHFHISSLLNITPDHIDRHGSMENYINTKKKIFNNQTSQDFSLIDIDNENLKKVFLSLKNDKNFKSKLIPISTAQIQEDGLALIDGILYNNINGYNSKLNLTSDFLCGKHNDQNMAFAFAMCFCLFIKNNSDLSNIEKNIINSIKKFKGLKHRLQIIGQIDGINFINDSKATNAQSTINALKAYDNIFWILGGKAKDGGIEDLVPHFKKITKAYLIGESSEEFAKTLEKHLVSFEKCDNLENAFKKSFFDAKSNSFSKKNILLSPACASFDQWKNFEERGDYFCKLFNELQNSKKG